MADTLNTRSVHSLLLNIVCLSILEEVQHDFLCKLCLSLIIYDYQPVSDVLTDVAPSSVLVVPLCSLHATKIIIFYRCVQLLQAKALYSDQSTATCYTTECFLLFRVVVEGPKLVVPIASVIFLRRLTVGPYSYRDLQICPNFRLLGMPT